MDEDKQNVNVNVVETKQHYINHLKMVALLHADVLDVSSYQIELMIMVLN